jgi:hypothetical protein
MDLSINEGKRVRLPAPMSDLFIANDRSRRAGSVGRPNCTSSARLGITTSMHDKSGR